jgi:hypothetical protein
MSRKRFGSKTALAGIAVVAIALGPDSAAIGSGNMAAASSQPTESCPHSTKSLKQLAIIDNTSDGSFQCLAVSLEGGTVRAIHVETHSFASQDGQTGPEQIKIEEFPKAVVESSRGAVLDGVPGHDAIIIRGHFSTFSDRLELVTSYLYNGFTGEYRSCQIALDRTPGTGWRLVNRLDQTVSHILVRTRQIPLIGTFGIANLEGACT